MIDSNFLDSKNFTKELIEFSKNLEFVLNNKNFLILFKENSIRSNRKFSILGSNSVSQNRFQEIFSRLINEKCSSEESKFSYSSVFTILFLKKILESGIKMRNVGKHFDFLKSLKEEFNFCSDFLSDKAEYPNMKNVLTFAGNVFDDKKSRNIFKESIRAAGQSGTIFIEDSITNKNSIELKSGHSFSFSPIYELYNKSNKWEKSNLKVLIVDGILANVHEIDQILREASQTKIPMAIFAKGFEGEIINTIKHNNDLNIFDIFLIKIETELERINILNDIAVICGTDIFSSLKGDVLSLIKYDEIPFIEKISCFKNRVVIFNDKTKKRVNLQIKNILEARNKTNDKKMIEIYNNRIKALKSRFVRTKISFGSISDKVNKTEEMDFYLNSLRTISKFGILKKSVFKQKKSGYNNMTMLDSVISEIDKINLDVIPYASFVAGLKSAIEISEILLKSEGILLEG